MYRSVLLLGGNSENSGLLLEHAGALLQEEAGSISARSALYKSPPWGFEHERWFMNQVLVLNSRLAPLELLEKAEEIEQRLGRNKKTRDGYEARPIDIDILFIDRTIINSPRLTVPHPRLHLRRFTLEPLNELMPDYIHPVFNKTVSALLEACPDQSEVQRIS